MGQFVERSLTMNTSGAVFVGSLSVLLMVLTLPTGISGETCSAEVCTLCTTNCNACNQCVLCNVCFVPAFCGMCNQCKNGDSKVDVAYCKNRCEQAKLESVRTAQIVKLAYKYKIHVLYTLYIYV